MSQPEPREFIRLKDLIVQKFTSENWYDIGAITDSIDVIEGHRRLLQSLSWNDNDYPGSAVEVLRQIIKENSQAFEIISEYVHNKWPSEYDSGDRCITSNAGIRKRITIAPKVFTVPDEPRKESLVAIMMPFAAQFDPVLKAIKKACEGVGMISERVDDAWKDSVIMQDVFSLLYSARYVICDFTGKNANVFYEAGIAHTLGRDLIPIAQHESDVPSDLRHHRYLPYLPNPQGLAKLTEQLNKRLFALLESEGDATKFF